MIILINWPYNNRSYYRLGLDVLEKHKIDFKLINLFELFNKNTKNIYYERKFYETELSVKNYYQLIKLLNKEKVILNFINLKKSTLPLFFLFTLLNKNYIQIDNMPLPSFSKKKYLPFFKCAKYGATIDSKFSFPFCKNTVFWNINSIDYDNYLRFDKKENKPIINNDYIVFIDQNLPFHLDFVRNNEKPYVTAENYYNSLNKFFNFVETKTRKEVVIALHPNSENKHSFSKRTIIGNTMNLVKYSKGVILHSSTAVSYAIIYNKPICMIETDEIINSKMHSFNKLMAGIFKLPLFNIDKTQNFEFSIGDYQTYKSRYISKGYENLSMEIILRKINDSFFK